MATYTFTEERSQYRMNGAAIKLWRVVDADGDTMAGDDLARRIQVFADANPDLEIMLALKLKGLGWRNSPSWRSAADGIALVANPEAYDMVGDDGDGTPLDSIEEAVIVARRRAVPAGGNDEGNACFWRALSRAFCGKLPAQLATDAALRTLARAPPPGTLFPATPEVLARVERALPADVALNVVGDAVYASAKRTPSRVVTLALYAEHFALRFPEGRSQTRALSSEQKPKGFRMPVVSDCCVQQQTVTLHAADGSTTTHARAAFTAWQQSPFAAPHILLWDEEVTAGRSTAAEGLERWTAARNALLPQCHLDLFRFGSYKAFALELFRYKSMAIPAAAPLCLMEEEWVLGAIRGGLIYGEPYEGPAVGIDVVSAYPAAMASKMQLPIGAGEFERLEALPDVISVGIYRARVTVPAAHARLWRTSPAGFYTHLDLETARLLGGTIALELGGGANACIYRPAAGRVAAAQIFGGFVSALMAARKATPGNKAPKIVLNMLWGALCERNKKTVVVSPDEDTDIVGDLINFGRRNDGTMWFKVRPPGPAFKGDYPRFAPFIISRVRSDMARMLLPHVAAVKRIHTDGAVLALPTLPESLSKLVGTELGALKLEHTGTVNVKNAMRVTWQ